MSKSLIKFYSVSSKPRNKLVSPKGTNVDNVLYINRREVDGNHSLLCSNIILFLLLDTRLVSKLF